MVQSDERLTPIAASRRDVASDLMGTAAVAELVREAAKQLTGRVPLFAGCLLIGVTDRLDGGAEGTEAGSGARPLERVGLGLGVDEGLWDGVA